MRRFRDTVREGQIEAAQLAGRFHLPKTYRRRGRDETYARHAHEMVFEWIHAFEQWFANTDQELSARRGRPAAPKVSLDAVEASGVDFKALAAETRRKLQASHANGQNLGSSRRGKAAGKAKAKTSR